MPATDYQGSSVPFSSIGRSLLSIRRDQVHTADGHNDAGSDVDIEVFQRHVTDFFQDLSSAILSDDHGGGIGGDNELLSLAWVRKLLDAFLICLEEFREIFFDCNRSQPLLSRPPLDRIVSDFFERAVKALDVCNAVRDGVDLLRRWRQHLEIVLAALAPVLTNKNFREGQLRRARKALVDLTLLMLDEKDSGGGSVVNHRNRSFGRSSKDTHHLLVGSGGNSSIHFRCLSWSVSRSWSAARQLQAIGNNLSAPRGNEISATNGLALPVFTINSLLLFVMWALVAAIPCQDRGLHAHFSVPRSFPWAASITSMYERILEESKRKDRKNSCGLLKEIQQIEKLTRHLSELIDSVDLPLPEEKQVELRQTAEELEDVCNALKDGLDPLERQVREVFQRIVDSRTEGLDCLNKAHNGE